MERNDWKFTYPASKLHDAAVAKKDFHAERLKWWTDQQSATKNKIKEEGIEIDDSLAAELVSGGGAKLSSNYHRGPIAQIRTEFLRDLEESTQKVAEHREKLKQYDAWSQVMASQKEHSYQLEHDDWMFFFGK